VLLSAACVRDSDFIFHLSSFIIPLEVRRKNNPFPNQKIF